MIPKLPFLGVALVTALAGQASAHDDRHDGRAKHSGHATPPPGAYATPVGYHGDGHRGDGHRAPQGQRAERHREDMRDLRQADVNRDGWVTLTEALRQARREFRQEDRDRNRVLTRREVSQRDLAQDDVDRNGRISYGEREDAIRRSFSRFDRDRDGLLARYELSTDLGSRPAAWRR
ncbi:MAG: hypothetical protein RL685_2421 [Pseudomonadota bacterium]